MILFLEFFDKYLFLIPLLNVVYVFDIFGNESIFKFLDFYNGV
jgi:hypothetical protein